MVPDTMKSFRFEHWGQKKKIVASPMAVFAKASAGNRYVMMAIVCNI